MLKNKWLYISLVLVVVAIFFTIGYFYHMSQQEVVYRGSFVHNMDILKG